MVCRSHIWLVKCAEEGKGKKVQSIVQFARDTRSAPALGRARKKFERRICSARIRSLFWNSSSSPHYAPHSVLPLRWLFLFLFFTVKAVLLLRFRELEAHLGRTRDLRPIKCDLISPQAKFCIFYCFAKWSQDKSVENL